MQQYGATDNSISVDLGAIIGNVSPKSSVFSAFPIDSDDPQI